MRFAYSAAGLLTHMRKPGAGRPAAAGTAAAHQLRGHCPPLPKNARNTKEAAPRDVNF